MSAFRTRKPEEDGELFRATTGRRDLLLIGPGRGSYLWLGESGESGFGAQTVHGDVALRKLAHAILDAIPERKP